MSDKEPCPRCGSVLVFVSDAMRESGISDGKVEYLCWKCGNRFLRNEVALRGHGKAENGVPQRGGEEG